MSKTRRAYTALGVVLAVIASVAFAGTFNLFSPASGILKGNANTYVTTAAASSDVIGLWSGTCNVSSFLRGDGACASVGSGTVTSVALTMPTGFSVGGSPVTTSGTLAVTTSLSGLLKGNGSGFTTAASSDVIGLWSGTCNASSFLRGDGACAAAGAGTVTSVGLTVPSGLSVTGSPVTGSGTLGITTSLSGVLKGTGSGFSTSASSDVIALWSGTCNASSFLRGDGACAAASGSPGGSSTQFQYNSSGTFAGASNFTYTSATGNVTIGAPTGGYGLQVTGFHGNYAVQVVGSSTAGGSDGVFIQAGVNSSDAALSVQNFAGTNLFQVRGDGAILGTGPVNGALTNMVPDSGTFTSTLSLGCTTSPTTTVKWVRMGNIVVLNFGNFGSCTSNTTLLGTDTSLPASIRPATNQCTQLVGAEDNGASTPANVRVASNGSVDFDKPGTSSYGCAGAGWTSSGVKSLGTGFSVTYQIAN